MSLSPLVVSGRITSTGDEDLGEKFSDIWAGWDVEIDIDEENTRADRGAVAVGDDLDDPAQRVGLDHPGVGVAVGDEQHARPGLAGDDPAVPAAAAAQLGEFTTPP